jgi:hypothetical protein
LETPELSDDTSDIRYFIGTVRSRDKRLDWIHRKEAKRADAHEKAVVEVNLCWLKSDF